MRELTRTMERSVRVWLGLALLALLAACSNVVKLPRPPTLPASLRLVDPPATHVDVLTQHNDRARTGANLNEIALTPDAIDREKSPGGFQYLGARPVDGQIYAQPLYVSDIEVNGRRRNVVFVATMHNVVYAFDADARPGKDDVPLWSQPLGKWLPDNFMKMDEGFLGLNIIKAIGITSTPVIDDEKNRIYVSAKVCTSVSCTGDHVTIVYRIAALNLRTGKIEQSFDLDDKTVFANALTGEPIAFQPRTHLQRPGLLLSKGRLYLAFASHQDTSPFHGWIIALDAETLRPRERFCTSCQTLQSDEAGIWQAGNGPAADDAGNVYVMTGNGPDDDPGDDYGSSFLKLTESLDVVTKFTPAGVACLNKQDVDLGSAGPMLLPDSNLIVGGGKEGVVYVLDRKDFGGNQPDAVEKFIGGITFFDIPLLQRACPAQLGKGPPLQSFQAGSPWSNPFPGGTPFSDWSVATMGYHHIHGSPVYWDSAKAGRLIYVWPERDRVRGFRFDPAKNQFVDVAAPGQLPTSTLTGPMSHKYGMPGAALSISANGNQGGILWATRPLEDNALTKVVAGVMIALDASTLRVLWDSRADGHVPFLLAKYAAPTIANGKVFVPTFSNRLDVYGLVQR